MLSAEFYRLIGIASLIAVPLSAWFLSRWLNNYLFHIPLRIWYLIVPVIMLLLISLLVIVRQTVRTIRLKPVDTLKDE